MNAIEPDVESSHERSNGFARGLIAGVSEVLFVALPLLVLALVFRYQHHFTNIWTSPEVSFAAIVLFGQALVKISGQVASAGGLHRERLRLLLTGIIVIGLVPSTVLLVFVLLAAVPSTVLGTMQCIWSGLGFAVFLYCTGVAHALGENE